MGTAGQGCNAPSKGVSPWEQEGLTPANTTKVAHSLYSGTTHSPQTRSSLKKPHTVTISQSLRVHNPGAACQAALTRLFFLWLYSQASRGRGPLEAPLGLEDQVPGGPLPGLVGGCWPAVGGPPRLCRRAPLQGCLRVLRTRVPTSQRAKKAEAKT